MAFPNPNCVEQPQPSLLAKSMCLFRAVETNGQEEPCQGRMADVLHAYRQASLVWAASCLAMYTQPSVPSADRLWGAKCTSSWKSHDHLLRKSESLKIDLRFLVVQFPGKCGSGVPHFQRELIPER